MVSKPAFLKNPDWYYFDEDKWMYVLKDNVPDTIRRSYENFYKNSDDKVTKISSKYFKKKVVIR